MEGEVQNTSEISGTKGQGFVFVCEDEALKYNGVELPTEQDGTLMLSVLRSQFEGATGLKYRNLITGAWRGVKVVGGVLHGPDEGWGDQVYVVVVPPGAKAGEATEDGAATTDGGKRKCDDSAVDEERAAKNPRSSSPEPSADVKDINAQDMLVLGLEWSVTDAELKKYFEQFGEVASAEVKKDAGTGRSRGFGFVRFFDVTLQQKVFNMQHTVKGRRVDLRYPRRSSAYVPCKVFVGCLPLRPQVTSQELREYFSQYGELTDVYIPNPYRGFGFVTFQDGQVAMKVLNMHHTFQGSNLNLTVAEPKGTKANQAMLLEAATKSYLLGAGFLQQDPSRLGYAAAAYRGVPQALAAAGGFTLPGLRAQAQVQQQRQQVTNPTGYSYATTTAQDSLGYGADRTAQAAAVAAAYQVQQQQQQQQQQFGSSVTSAAKWQY